MASKLFLSDSFYADILGILSLQTDTIKAALVTSALATGYSAWVASTPYDVDDIVIPTTRTGRRYICTVSGTSHSSEPTWPTTDKATVTDNTATWQEYGGDLADLDVWADASGSEVASGDGYTTGGATVGGISAVSDGQSAVLSATNVTWSALSKTMRYAFLYANKTVGSQVNPIIGYILLNDDYSDVTVSGVDFIVNWDAAGVLQLTRG